MSALKQDDGAFPEPQRWAASPEHDSESNDEISLTDIHRALAKHKWLILITTVLVFACAAVYTFMTPRVYESSVILQIDPGRSSSPGLEDLINEKLGSEDPGGRLMTEVRIIESATVASRVIDALNLPQNPAFVGRNQLVPAGTPLTDPQRQAMVGMFLGSLKVRSIPSTQIVEVHFRSRDPKLSALVANTLVEKYMERNLETRYQSTVQVSNWLSHQMADLQSRADDSQRKLADFQKEHNVLGVDENDNIIVDRLKMLNQQLTEAEADRIVKEARYRLAATGNPEFIATVVPTLQNLRNQEAELRAQVAQLSAKYGSGYPRLREEQAQLKELQAAIQKEVANVGTRLHDEYQSSANAEKGLRNEFERQKEEAYKLNQHAIEYAVLKHDVESGRDLHDNLQLKLRLAGVTAGLNSTYISVIDRAEVPIVPVLPRRSMNLLAGLLGGLLLGVVLAYAVESMDDTLSSSEELEAVAHLPVLCNIPESGKSQRRQLSGEVRDHLPNIPIMLEHPNSQAAEAFRGLRTSLLLSSPDRPQKLIAVVSSLAAEGKTTVSVNLGIAFAQRGESVLLIDADLRRSTMHNHFSLPQAPFGVSTVLTQGFDERALLSPVPSLPLLKLMPAGPHPPNPSELLGSRRMQQMLQDLSQRFDRIVIDTPPVISVADSLALTHIADSTVLVVRSGVSRRKAVRRGRDLLNRAKSHLVGIVFNCVNLKLENYNYARGSYYSKKMNSYYGEDHKEQD